MKLTEKHAALRLEAIQYIIKRVNELGITIIHNNWGEYDGFPEVIPLWIDGPGVKLPGGDLRISDAYAINVPLHMLCEIADRLSEIP
jgi:hypothetical protein